MNESKFYALDFVKLQFLVMIYSGVSVMSKISSNVMKDKGMFSLSFVFCIIIMFLILGVYAILWQIIIKKIEVSTAYLNKSVGIFWSLLWSYSVFGESINLLQVVGLIIVVIGVRVIYLYGK